MTLVMFLPLTNLKGQTISNTDSLFKSYENELYNVKRELNGVKLSLGKFYKQRQGGITTIITGMGITTLGSLLLLNELATGRPDIITPSILLSVGGIVTSVGTIVYISSDRHLKKYRIY